MTITGDGWELTLSESGDVTISVSSGETVGLGGDASASPNITPETEAIVSAIVSAIMEAQK